MFHGIYSEGEVREWGKFKPGGWLLVPAATSARIENLGEPEYSFESWDALVPDDIHADSLSVSLRSSDGLGAIRDKVQNVYVAFRAKFIVHRTLTQYPDRAPKMLGVPGSILTLGLKTGSSEQATTRGACR
ncbi:hypothetical protein M404DRAFT_22116 [Pisolithus tinctorius Marx 270]|uniref:Uncharacterized protein n=1 Tax=Pisolithus tinctorius Marx 270 TaxID=870435 RepID=A0A0C3P856_PISTI|nr:hypothetical protein M404DRAFT_22116 [Pisolithus tinctorius Marx 270]